MDTMFLLHLFIFFSIASIPFWPIPYLKYGVYIPLIVAFTWLACNGCPITKRQKNLSSNSFTKEIYAQFMPNITDHDVRHFNTFALILITVVGFRRLL